MIQKQFIRTIIISIVLLFIANQFIRVSGSGDKSSTGYIEYLKTHSFGASTIRLIFLVLFIFIFRWLYFLVRGFKIPGVSKFWYLVSRNPDAAYEWFLQSSAWKVFEYPPPPDFRQIVPELEWAGPFDLYVPAIGARVQIFGRIGQFESAREEFTQIIKSGKKIA